MARKDLNQLKKHLSALRTCESAGPNLEWKHNFRQALLIKIKTRSMADFYEQKLAEDLGFFGFLKTWKQPRLIFAPATMLSGALLFFFTLSFGTVWAAKGSLPGDVLFPVKLAVERTQMVTKKEPAEKTKFQVEITNRRVDELARLSQSPEDSKKTENMEQAISEITSQLNTVKSDLPKIENGTNESAMKTAREVTNDLSKMESVLNEIKKEAKTENLDKKIASIAKLADTASTDALTVVARKAPDSGLSDDERGDISDQVGRKISETEAKIQLMDDKIKEIKPEDKRSAFSLRNTPSSASQISADLVREQSLKARAILSRAKESLKEENLLSALETVKTAKEIVLSAESLIAKIEEANSALANEEKEEEIKNTASGAGTAPQETTPPVTEPENEEPTNEEKPVSVIPEATVRGNVVGPVLE